MNYILDLIILIIVLLSMFIGAKKGFALTVTGMVCFLLAVVLSFTLSSKLADTIYNRFMEERVETVITEKLDKAGFSLIEENTQSELKFVETVKHAIRESTVFAIDSSNVGATDDIIEQNISESTASTSEQFAAELSQRLVKPIAVRILESLFFFALFILFVFLIKPITAIINKLFSFSVIGTLNKTLGGLSGIFVGVLICVAFVNLVNSYVNISNTEILGLTPQVLNDTYLFSYLLKCI